MKDLFQNPNLSFDEINALLDKVLDFKKWEVEKKLENRLRVAEIQNSSRRTVAREASDSEAPGESVESCSEEERDFNDLTSYGFCRDIHIGKISKTKIWEASNMKSTDLFVRWKAHIENTYASTFKELNDKRLRTLLLNFLWAHGCAYRITRWPDAPDLDGVKGLKADLTARLNKYPRAMIVAGYEALKIFWNEINDYNQVPYNSTLIADVLDASEEEVRLAQANSAVVAGKDIKTSPLFSAFAREFPEPSLDLLEKCYQKCRGDFVKSSVMTLRRHYTEHVPESMAEQFTEEDWKKRWHMFLPSILEEWTKRLRNIKITHITDQKEWEST